MHAFDVLGDPVRRRILELLADGERSSGEVSEVIRPEFGISQPAVSQHLKVLRDNGFATVRPDGARRLYAVDDTALREPTTGSAGSAGSGRRAWPPWPPRSPAEKESADDEGMIDVRADQHRAAHARPPHPGGGRGPGLHHQQVYDTDLDVWVGRDRSRSDLPLVPAGTGELKEGGHYQLEGNAGGTVTSCDKPHGYAATWEMGTRSAGSSCG